VNKFALLAIVALSIAGCGSQDKTTSLVSANASIPFSEFGRIYDWRADGRTGIFIESEDRKWFHATFMAPCENLPFTEHVGFHTTPPLPIDKFDSIEVRGENCYFNSLETAAGPPSAAPKPAKP
jgi:Family of unknown function (DUF6491)